MSSLYFAAAKTGYTKQPIQGAIDTDHSKRIPVYKTVNEYMNHKEEEDSNIIEQIEEDFDSQLRKSTQSLDIPMKKKAKRIFFDSAQMMEKSEVNSIDGDDFYLECNKEKEFSSKDTNASRIQKSLNDKIKASQMNGNNKSELENQLNTNLYGKSILEIQIAKEKTLCKNLENSYKNLLDKLKAKEKQYDNDFMISAEKLKRKDTESCTIKNQIRQISYQHPKQNIEGVKMSSSCGKLENTQYQSEDSSESETKSDKNIENRYFQHLQGQKIFQNDLLAQLENVHNHIDELQHNLIKRQYRVKFLLKEKQLEISESNICKLTKNNSQLKQQLSTQRQPQTTSIKQHIHYIFTIFIMFLLISMVLKRQT